jgi:hypothetical protein
MNRDSLWQRSKRQTRRSPRLRSALIRIALSLRRSWLWIWRIVIPASWTFGPPKGWFSIFSDLKANRVSGQIITESQRAPRARPKSLREMARLRQHQPSSWPIFWSHHKPARLVGPTLLLMNDRKRVAWESGWQECLVHDPAYAQFRRPPAIHLPGNWTSVVGRWSDGFYHWFLDALPRLALLEAFPPDTRILVPAGLRQYQLDSLRMLGLEGRYRQTSEQHIIAENFYFSSPTAMTGTFDPYAVGFLRRALLPHRDQKFSWSKQIYVRRVGAGRGIVNEAEVLAFFERRGWAIIDTERLTLAEQIQVFAEAEHICTLHGAALANLVWCRPGCRVLEMVASTFLNGVYEGISEAVGLDYSFLLCPGDTDFRALVDLNELERMLR